MTAPEFSRACVKSLGLAAVILGGMFVYLVRVARRSQAKSRHQILWMQAMSRSFLRVLNGTVEVHGEIPNQGLIVCNHLGYVDILVIGSVCPAVFVAKRDVCSWPVFGRLTKMAGTVFVERTAGMKTRVQVEDISRSLQAGFPVVLFPEGTSSDGSAVLPFRSSLLQAASASRCPVTPAALCYSAEAGGDVSYWGDMVFVPHLFKLLSKKSFRATLVFGKTRPAVGDRKQEAATLHGLVATLLRGIPETRPSKSGAPVPFND